MHPDVDKTLKLVEEMTGYSVTVSRDEAVDTYAALTIASTAKPAHLIRLNPRYERIADYVVALQAAMILVKCADPRRIHDARLCHSRFCCCGDGTERLVESE